MNKLDIKENFYFIIDSFVHNFQYVIWIVTGCDVYILTTFRTSVYFCHSVN